ncbi:MAG: ABC transporter permease [Gammaproteobacteria bacterium]|nr:MAG: ABC transporter permease [Gammaproteobacteria bacterium]
MSAVAGAAAPPVNLNVVRWIGFQTIVIREYGRIIRIWGQTIVPSVVTATLYFVIFGSLIGRRVGAMGGFDYKQYIAPGLIMMSVITNSYGNVVASFFGAKFGKHVEEMLVSPLPNWVIVAGYAAGGVVRGLLVGAAVTVVSLLFTHLSVQHLPVIVAAGLLTSLIFALGGFLNALFAKNFDQVNWIPTFVLTPLTYFGGVFYSVTLLPQWAQQVSYVNPILHMVNAFRFGFLGVSDVSVGLAFALISSSRPRAASTRICRRCSRRSRPPARTPRSPTGTTPRPIGRASMRRCCAPPGTIPSGCRSSSTGSSASTRSPRSSIPRRCCAGAPTSTTCATSSASACRWSRPPLSSPVPMPGRRSASSSSARSAPSWW